MIMIKKMIVVTPTQIMSKDGYRISSNKRIVRSVIDSLDGDLVPSDLWQLLLLNNTYTKLITSVIVKELDEYGNHVSTKKLWRDKND